MTVKLLTKTGASATTDKSISNDVVWPDEVTWSSRTFKYHSATGPAPNGVASYIEVRTTAAAS
jgi:hypothetical protein